MRSRFSSRWSPLFASRHRRLLTLIAATVGGFVIGAFITLMATLLLPSDPPAPSIEVALPAPPDPAPLIVPAPPPSPPSAMVPPEPPAAMPSAPEPVAPEFGEFFPPSETEPPPTTAQSEPQLPEPGSPPAVMTPAPQAVEPPPPESPSATVPEAPWQRPEPASPPPPVAALPDQPRPELTRPTPPPDRPALVQPGEELPAWQRYAVAAPQAAGRAMIAIVIDDMGLDQRRSAEMMSLPAPLTLAFLPYGRDLPRQTAAARRKGHELLVHIPMEPKGAHNPGPNALTVDLAPDEIRRRLAQALAAFDGYVGINNHMGSRFTTDRAGMDVVIAELKARGLLFLDSRTVPYSLGASTAAAHDVPHAGRHVFLDNELSAEELRRQLAETERIAREAGLAIAIGHPHDVTIAALKAWLPTLEKKGFVLAPVSAVVERMESRRNATATAPVDAEERAR